MFSLNPIQYYKNLQLKKMVEQQWETVKYTPDAGEIERQWRHPVFVCDDYMRNRPLYVKWGMLKEYSQYRGRGFTDSYFNGYWVISKQRAVYLPNSREAMLEGWAEQTSAHPVPVLGEVMLVPTAVIKELDKRMENGYSFIRTPITVKIWCAKSVWTPFGTKPPEGVKLKKTEIGTRVRTPLVPKRVEAWMYIANPEHWIPDNGFDYKPLKIYSAINGVQPTNFVFHSLRRIPRHT
jgi:hypothetical protein